MKINHFLIGIIYFISLLITPRLAIATDPRCFITLSRICIFNSYWANFGLDLSNEYSLQELLAEIAFKYAQAGNIQQARHIAEALTIENSRNAALSALDDFSPTNEISFEIQPITQAEKQQLLDVAKSATDEETKVRVAVELAEVGLFEEAEAIRKTLENKAFQSLVLIHFADIDISRGNQEMAQEKLAAAVELAMSLECNVSPCSAEDDNSRILERLRRPAKPRL